MKLACHASVSLSIHQLHSTACRTFSQQLFGAKKIDPLPVERFHISGHGVLSGTCAMIRNNSFPRFQVLRTQRTERSDSRVLGGD
jgi:hypothetical protein